jgi:hypothetical protein
VGSTVGPKENRVPNWFYHWSSVLVLDLYFLHIDLKKDFGGLSLKATTGDALIGVSVCCERVF